MSFLMRCVLADIAAGPGILFGLFWMRLCLVHGTCASLLRCLCAAGDPRQLFFEPLDHAVELGGGDFHPGHPLLRGQRAQIHRGQRSSDRYRQLSSWNLYFLPLPGAAELRIAVPADAYRPVSIDQRLGMQSGAGVCAWRKRAPPRATRPCVGA